MKKPAELPWSDCKVAFDIEDNDLFWDAPSEGLPPGWERDETDSSSTHCVGIFRVNVALRKKDGIAVQAWLKKHGNVPPPYEESK